LKLVASAKVKFDLKRL